MGVQVPRGGPTIAKPAAPLVRWTPLWNYSTRERSNQGVKYGEVSPAATNAPNPSGKQWSRCFRAM